MKEPILQLAQANFFSSSPTFLYTFDYEGAFSRYSLYQMITSHFIASESQNKYVFYRIRFGYGADISQYSFKGGVAHQDELIYVFPYPLDVANLKGYDLEMAKKMTNLIASFVTFGTPHLTTDPNFQWPPMTSTINFFCFQTQAIFNSFKTKFRSNRSIFTYKQ